MSYLDAPQPPPFTSAFIAMQLVLDGNPSNLFEIVKWLMEASWENYHHGQEYIDFRKWFNS